MKIDPKPDPKLSTDTRPIINSDFSVYLLLAPRFSPPSFYHKESLRLPSCGYATIFLDALPIILLRVNMEFPKILWVKNHSGHQVLSGTKHPWIPKNTLLGPETLGTGSKPVNHQTKVTGVLQHGLLNYWLVHKTIWSCNLHQKELVLSLLKRKP